VLAELVRRLATENGIIIKFYVTCDILNGRKMVTRDNLRGSPWYIYAKAYFYPNHQITADLQSNTFMQENIKAHVQPEPRDQLAVVENTNKVERSQQ
jgi:hypothetical protein